MAFHRISFFKNPGTLVMYFSLYISSVFINAACSISNTSFVDDNEYYKTWDLKKFGKHSLKWFYKSQEDYRKNQPNTVLVDDRKFVIYPDVRPPTINGIYMMEYSHVNEGEEVLDIGTGSGIHAIFATDTAKHVVATDIFAPAVENAKINAKLHSVEQKIDFRVGDLFEPINDDEKFDVIFFNINFPFKPDSKDRKKLHERFFSEVRKYMNPDARIYYQTSYIDNIPYIYDMLSRNNFHIKEIHMEHMLPYHHEPLFIMIQSRY